MLDVLTGQRLKNLKSVLFDNPKDIMEAEESSFAYSTSCEVGVSSSCNHNEECIRNSPKGRAGII